MAGIAKSTTTPTHKTTLYTMGLTKGLTASTGNPLASSPTQQQTSHMSSAATPFTMPQAKRGK